MSRYRVSGIQPVDGHKPGDEYEASYPEAHELYLLTGGHLELVTRPKKAAGKKAGGQVDGGDEPDAASPQNEQDLES